MKQRWRRAGAWLVFGAGLALMVKGWLLLGLIVTLIGVSVGDEGTLPGGVVLALSERLFGAERRGR